MQDLQRARRRGRRRARLPQPVLRRRAHPVRHLRARDPAVHHGVDHHADPRRGHPTLEQWQQQGAVGQRKITQWTRYLDRRHRPAAVHGPSPSCSTTAVAASSAAAAASTSARPAARTSTRAASLIVVLTLTAGTALLMWMGELITQRGIGNGMSLLIFASIVSASRRSRRPGRRRTTACRAPRRRASLLAIGIMVAIVFVEQGQRRIPVQFAKRVVGRRMYGGQSTYIPLKVNQSGVIPIIFASSVLYLPLLLSQVPPGRSELVASAVAGTGSTTTSCSPTPGLHPRVRPADRRLRLLLHGDPVRSRPAGRHHPQAGWLHPRHPSGSPDRALPRPDPHRITLPGALFIADDRAAAVDPAGHRRHQRTSRSAASRCSSPSAWCSRR